MLNSRILPLLLLDEGRLVKTVNFEHPKYVGDPLNTFRIFNEKEVDEILLLDISASRMGRGPDFSLLERLSSEIRMPFTYGGGITSPREVERLVSLGIEKVAISSAFFGDESVVVESARIVGSQSVAVIVNSFRNRGGEVGWAVLNSREKRREALDVVEVAERAELCGAGELIINSVDRDGTKSGFDFELLSILRSQLSIPLTIAGGASSAKDFSRGNKEFGPLGMAAGSLFVFTGKFDSVLIQYFSRSEREAIFA